MPEASFQVCLPMWKYQVSMFAKAEHTHTFWGLHLFFYEFFPSQNFREIRLFCQGRAQAGEVEAGVPARPGRASLRGKGTKPIQDA